jgi:hypothetical protein
MTSLEQLSSMELLQDSSEAGPASINRYEKMKDPVQLGP